MFDRLKAWLAEGGREAQGEAEPELAVAALLMEAAHVDGHLDEPERAAVRRILEQRFSLDEGAVRELTAAAERQAERSTQLFGMTRLLSERFSRDRRIEVIEMLWEVAYADGKLDPLEDAMLRRVAGLVDVSDHERGEAKLRVLRRLGLPEQG
ncbi:MAG TPA: TerB family tellurite resistance protein [Stellaceae bacterium]|nr:TerB family tellurite resistance protein [Stellaceae bacterium]